MTNKTSKRTLEQRIAQLRRPWYVYEIEGKFFFDAKGPRFGKQTFGPYENKIRATDIMTECDSIWR